jgi:predicted HicB family RNase H-like nuclease
MKDILNYNGFTGSVHFSIDDHVFFGKIEGINDLVTYEGTNLEELEQGFQSMVDEQFNDTNDVMDLQ